MTTRSYTAQEVGSLINLSAEYETLYQYQTFLRETIEGFEEISTQTLSPERKRLYCKLLEALYDIHGGVLADLCGSAQDELDAFKEQLVNKAND
jgi:hypothetical protein